MKTSIIESKYSSLGQTAGKIKLQRESAKQNQTAEYLSKVGRTQRRATRPISLQESSDGEPQPLNLWTQKMAGLRSTEPECTHPMNFCSGKVIQSKTLGSSCQAFFPCLQAPLLILHADLKLVSSFSYPILFIFCCLQ